MTTPIPIRTDTIPLTALHTWAEEQLDLCNQMVAGAKINGDQQMTDRWQGSANAFTILLEYLDSEEAQACSTDCQRSQPPRCR